MATIKDVAKLAGVSATTVSIVINGKAEERGITKKTQEKVWAAMKELSYQPNLSARRLRFQDTSKPTIAFFWPFDSRTPIIAAFLNSLQREIKAQNFNCEFIVQTYENDCLEQEASTIVNNSYNAAIIGGASSHDIKYLESIKPSMPIILINRKSDIFSTVYTDNNEIGFKAASLFHKKGYKEVAVISSDNQFLATSLRRNAFLEACSKLGINVLPQHILTGVSTISGGAMIAEKFCKLEDPPKALFFESDSMAIGALYTFNKYKIRIPEDIEILSIGMLDSESTEFCIPSLSVIQMPNDKISHLIIEAMKDKLSKNDLSPTHYKVDSKIILRESFTL